MLDELEKIARYNYDGFKHLRKCKCWYVIGKFELNDQEKHTYCIRYIKRRHIPIKYGDVVIYVCTVKYSAPYYYHPSNILIYDGKNFLSAVKYHAGRFKIWETHPTTGIFINRNYWSDVFLNSVYFDHTRYTITPTSNTRMCFTDHCFKIVINKNAYFIHSKNKVVPKKNQQFKYYIDTPDNMIMIWDY